MPIVYISFTSSKDIENDINKAKRYSSYAVSQGYIPISPILQFSYVINDLKDLQRDTINYMNLVILTKCQELWCFGDKTPGGNMVKEITKARVRNMTVRYFSDNCEVV